MAASGMTQRQIGDVLGVDHVTVLNDLKGSGENSPKKHAGSKDGGENSPDRTAEIIQRAIQDAYDDAQAEEALEDKNISAGSQNCLAVVQCKMHRRDLRRPHTLAGDID
jgi:hypothetical protein